MTEPAYMKALKEYGSGEPTKMEIASLEAELYAGPDRGAAVLLTSLVERSLGKLLRDRMRQEGVSDMFKFNGPAGSLSGKIQLAYAFNLIGPVTRHDLEIIRALRNQFAHSRRPIEFETDVVKDACDHLKLPDQPDVLLSFHMLSAVPEERLRQAADKTHPRTRFFTACNEVAQRVYFQRGGLAASSPLNQLP